jgi:hypothetical protein
MKRSKLSRLTTGRITYLLPLTADPRRVAKVLKIAADHRTHLHEVRIEEEHRWIGREGYLEIDSEPVFCHELIAYAPFTKITIRHRYSRLASHA